jgi:hypothetical protein
MTTTDVLAIIGAVTGVTGTIAGLGALGWDYYKWRYSERVQLKVTATPNFISTDNPDEEFIMVSVANIGKIPTTLKLISLQGFESKKKLKKQYGQKIGVVNKILYGPLPFRLEPGSDWTGGIRHGSGIEPFLDYEYFVIQVEDTMSTKPFRAIVDKSRIKKLSS